MKLLIPGPVNVDERYLRAMTIPMIGHRGKEFEQLHNRIVFLIRLLLNTDNDVFLMTSSASGAMEAAIRNTVKKNVLCIANGDFGRRWHEIALMNGKSSTLLDFGDAKPYVITEIIEALESQQYDAVTTVINETTTGMENNISGLKEILKDYPDILLLSDAVTAAFGTKIDLTDIDVLVFGTQKALALPPGMAVSIVSKKSIDRTMTVKDRGYYFDYILMKKNADKGFTVSTPNISLMYALKERLEHIYEEGMDKYVEKHNELSKTVRDAMLSMGFELLIDDINASKTLTVIKNNLEIDVKKLQESLRQEGFELANGYGQLKDITFRFGHMGLDSDSTLQAIEKIREIVLKMQKL